MACQNIKAESRYYEEILTQRGGRFGHWILIFGIFLKFGACDLEFICFLEPSGSFGF